MPTFPLGHTNSALSLNSGRYVVVCLAAFGQRGFFLAEFLWCMRPLWVCA